MAEPAAGARGPRADAERALDALAARGGGPAGDLGRRYDELAAVAAAAGDHELAARAQRRAIEHGCDDPARARELLACHLLAAGRRVAGEFAFASLLAERGEDDVELQLTIAAARCAAGHRAEALAAADAALAAARAHDDREELALARAERAALRRALGLGRDEDDRRAAEAGAGAPLAVGWLPRDEHAAAAARWPELAGPLADADAYCRAVERALRVARADARAPALVELRVPEALAFARSRGLDEASAATLAGHAAERAGRGERVPWPPRRTEPCWCRSGRLYRRCCGAG